MAEIWGRDLKPPVDGLFYWIFGFGTFFRYHDFKHEIDTWDPNVLPKCTFLLKAELKSIALNIKFDFVRNK